MSCGQVGARTDHVLSVWSGHAAQSTRAARAEESGHRVSAGVQGVSHIVALNVVPAAHHEDHHVVEVRVSDAHHTRVGISILIIVINNITISHGGSGSSSKISMHERVHQHHSQQQQQQQQVHQQNTTKQRHATPDGWACKHTPLILPQVDERELALLLGHTLVAALLLDAEQLSRAHRGGPRLAVARQHLQPIRARVEQPRHDACPLRRRQITQSEWVQDAMSHSQPLLSF
eukprot:2687033-Rhodomonas_salina.1